MQSCRYRCFDPRDFQITQPSTWRHENSYIFVPGRPHLGISRSKDEHAACARGCSEVRDSAVVSDEDRALEHRGQVSQRQIFCETDISIFPLAFQLLSL